MSEPDTPCAPSTRSDGWTADRQRIFIECLAETGSVSAAARAVGMSASGAYRLRRQPHAEAFRRAWDAALEAGIERLTDVAMERAINGVQVPVFHKGELVTHRTVYNDRLLMFLLRQRDPCRYSPMVYDTSITFYPRTVDPRDTAFEALDALAPPGEKQSSLV